MRIPFLKSKQPDVDGLVIAVTGAARGIGLATARRLASRGARVAIGDLDLDSATAAAATVPGARGYRLDVTDDESFAAFLGAAATDLGPIDVLVNNAGVMWVGSFDDEPTSASEAMVAVNLLGVIRGVRLAAPTMRTRGHGQIITIASSASRLAPPGMSTYAATKHGVLGYLTGVREELRRSGVTLTIVMPTVVDTELATGAATGSVALLQPDDVADAVLAAVGTRRFHVWVPGKISPLIAISGILPQSLRDRMMRFAVPDQVAAVSGSTARAEYERSVTGRPD